MQLPARTESRVALKGRESNSKHTYMSRAMYTQKYKNTSCHRQTPATRIFIFSDNLHPFKKEAIRLSIPVLGKSHVHRQVNTDSLQTLSLPFSFQPSWTDAPTLVIDNHNGQHVVFAQHHSELVAANTANRRAKTTQYQDREKEKESEKRGGGLQERGGKKRGARPDPFIQKNYDNMSPSLYSIGCLGDPLIIILHPTEVPQ